MDTLLVIAQYCFVTLKTNFVASSGELLIIWKHCEKRLPLMWAACWIETTSMHLIPQLFCEKGLCTRCNFSIGRPLAILTWSVRFHDGLSKQTNKQEKSSGGTQDFHNGGDLEVNLLRDFTLWAFDKLPRRVDPRCSFGWEPPRQELLIDDQSPSRGDVIFSGQPQVTR